MSIRINKLLYVVFYVFHSVPTFVLIDIVLQAGNDYVTSSFDKQASKCVENIVCLTAEYCHCDSENGFCD